MDALGTTHLSFFRPGLGGTFPTWPHFCLWVDVVLAVSVIKAFHGSDEVSRPLIPLALTLVAMALLSLDSSSINGLEFPVSLSPTTS